MTEVLAPTNCRRTTLTSLRVLASLVAARSPAIIDADGFNVGAGGDVCSVNTTSEEVKSTPPLVPCAVKRTSEGACPLFGTKASGSRPAFDTDGVCCIMSEIGNVLT
jgi:hypothetical protein